MKKIARALFLTLALMLAVGLALPQAAPPASADNSVEVQLGIIIDGSGSINTNGWNIILDGMAATIEGDGFPKDGTVELTIVQFGGTESHLEIGPLVIDSEAKANATASQIRSISQLGSYTPLACGIYLLADTLSSALKGQQSSPTTNSGHFADPQHAYDDGGDSALAYDGEEHEYYNYGFSVPDGSTIKGIEVRLDACHPWGSTSSIEVELSWNGGTNWTSTGYGTGELGWTGCGPWPAATYYVGGPDNTWGHTWTADEINDELVVHLNATASDSVSLDWVPVTVYYLTNDKFNPELVQSINIVTDGIANRCCDGYTGGYQCADAPGSAVDARDYLINELQLNSTSRDRINAEYIATEYNESHRNWLRDYIVWPQPGEIADPSFPEDVGWVRVTANYTEFAEAIEHKVEITTLELDFGDAPDPKYPTLIGGGGQGGRPPHHSRQRWYLAGHRSRCRDRWAARCNRHRRRYRRKRR